MRSEKGSYFIRILIAAYLIYLGVKLVRSMAAGEQAENPVLFTIIGIAFIGISAFLIVQSVRGLMRVQKEAQEAEEEEAAEEAQKALEESAGAETAAEKPGTDAAADSSGAAAPENAENGPMSIADRIRLLSDEPEDDAEDPDVPDEPESDAVDPDVPVEPESDAVDPESDAGE